MAVRSVVVDANIIFSALLSRESTVPAEIRREAWDLCQDVDPSDTPHVAITLHLDGRLWTGDKQLRTGLEAKGFDRFFDP